MSKLSVNRGERGLSPEDKVKVAYFYLVKKIPQSDLADLMDVNSGRISEAVKTVREATE